MTAKPMKTFARHRSAEEIKVLAATKGFTVDSAKHDTAGWDHVAVHMTGPSGRVVPVLYNTFNGRFFYAPANGVDAFKSDDAALDGLPWFDTMLEFFYVEPVSP